MSSGRMEASKKLGRATATCVAIFLATGLFLIFATPHTDAHTPVTSKYILVVVVFRRYRRVRIRMRRGENEEEARRQKNGNARCRRAAKFLTGFHTLARHHQLPWRIRDREAANAPCCRGPRRRRSAMPPWSIASPRSSSQRAGLPEFHPRGFARAREPRPLRGSPDTSRAPRLPASSSIFTESARSANSWSSPCVVVGRGASGLNVPGGKVTLSPD